MDSPIGGYPFAMIQSTHLKRHTMTVSRRQLIPPAFAARWLRRTSLTAWRCPTGKSCRPRLTSWPPCSRPTPSAGARWARPSASRREA